MANKRIPHTLKRENCAQKISSRSVNTGVPVFAHILNPTPSVPDCVFHNRVCVLSSDQLKPIIMLQSNKIRIDLFDGILQSDNFVYLSFGIGGSSERLGRRNDRVFVVLEPGIVLHHRRLVRPVVAQEVLAAKIEAQVFLSG